MDVAQLICERAAQMHADDVERQKIVFYVSFNYAYGNTYAFELRAPGVLRFNSCDFKVSRQCMFVILNQMAKSFARTYGRSIRTIYMSVCNSTSEVLSTRLPHAMRPCVKLVDLYEFDADMSLDVLSTAYDHFWRFVRRFRLPNNVCKNDLKSCA